MQKYAVLYTLTEQGAKNIKHSMREQGEACDKSLAALGCKVLTTLATMGEYDFLAIIEAPSEDAMMQYLLGVAALGNLRTTTLPAFTWGEFMETIDKLP